MPVASVLYRVAQEAVRNAVRHARPQDLVLALTADGRQVALDVTDDGVGFDVAAVEASRDGMGCSSCASGWRSSTAARHRQPARRGHARARRGARGGRRRRAARAEARP
jgi:two-component sensor histidine kinase